MRGLVLVGVAAILLTGCAAAKATPPISAATQTPSTPASTSTATPTATATAPPAAATYPLACVAEKDAVAGDWSGAESQYTAAESATSSLLATAAFAELGSAAGEISLDQLEDESTTTDITNYQQDVAAYSKYFKGCSS